MVRQKVVQPKLDQLNCLLRLWHAIVTFIYPWRLNKAGLYWVKAYVEGNLVSEVPRYSYVKASSDAMVTHDSSKGLVLCVVIAIIVVS